MNIHEHQAKKILKDFGAPVSNGVVITSLDEISEKIKKFEVKRICIKSSNPCRRKRKSRWSKTNKRYKSIRNRGKKNDGKKY